MGETGPDPILPLELKGVGFTAGGKSLLEQIDLRLEAGSRTVVLGPNGAGKSLLLRLCHGLLKPTSGTLRWCGGAPASAARLQAFVFQRPVLLRRSALANVEYALAVRGVRGAERRERAEAALERTGLSAVARRPARVLSGGEQQRLALARAWALAPRVLFLDEPTASLDPAATRTVEELVDAIHAGGTKVVMTTHDLGQAHRLADDVIFMHRGRCLEHTPAATFFERPQSEAAATFLAGDLFW
ncbi:MAG: ATP-binding cassette domain-containing protein [Gammaproteobacteria bacterium]